MKCIALFTVFFILSVLTACGASTPPPPNCPSAGPTSPPTSPSCQGTTDTNTLHEASGLCGHAGEPCCLGDSSNFFQSYCSDGGACVGADLGCTDADGANGATPPAECGTCGDPSKLYKFFCTEDPPAAGQPAPADQTSYVFVEKECALEARCGYIAADAEAACVAFFDIVASGRCWTPITSSDAKISECFAEMDSFACRASEDNVRPAVCDMLFFSKQKTTP